MEVFTELREMDAPSAVALGYFDGVHTAHAQVIGAAVAQKAAGLIPTVLSFRADGRLPANKPALRGILTGKQKLERLEALGVERVFLPGFSSIANQPAEDFVRQTLFGLLKAKAVACGFDYTFGRGAAGDAALLERLCREAGVMPEVLPERRLDGAAVSSTAIREALLAGDIPKANRLLGYEYYILGAVVHGRSLGRTLGFPTLNQPFEPAQLVPRFGVYNSTTRIAGREYASITNIGVKPTIEGERAPLAETYLIGGEGDFYGQEARVALLEMTRPEQKFDSLDELRAAVLRDIAAREGRHG